MDFWHFAIFREGAPKRPKMLEGCSIRFQAAQYSYFTDSERSWPPATTQYSYEFHTSLHKIPKKHVLWEFSMAHSSSGWVLILSKIFWWKNMDLQLSNAVSDVFIRHLISFLRLKVEYIWKSPKTSKDLTKTGYPDRFSASYIFCKWKRTQKRWFGFSYQTKKADCNVLQVIV